MVMINFIYKIQRRFYVIKKSNKKDSKTLSIKFFIVVLVLILAVIAGYFTCKTLTKNDKFEIIGEKTITLEIGDEYIDQGAKAIAFGKDISSQIRTESNVDYDNVGEYYIKYFVDNILYKDVFRYRYIKIVEVANE